MRLRRSPLLTPRSLAARRANALKSTGPRTSCGKARVSLNALKEDRSMGPAGCAPRFRSRLLRASYPRQEALYGGLCSLTSEMLSPSHSLCSFLKLLNPLCYHLASGRSGTGLGEARRAASQLMQEGASYGHQEGGTVQPPKVQPSRFAEGLVLSGPPTKIANRILALHAKDTHDALLLVARYLGSDK